VHSRRTRMVFTRRRNLLQTTSCRYGYRGDSPCARLRPLNDSVRPRKRNIITLRVASMCATRALMRNEGDVHSRERFVAQSIFICRGGAGSSTERGPPGSRTNTYSTNTKMRRKYIPIYKHIHMNIRTNNGRTPRTSRFLSTDSSHDAAPSPDLRDTTRMRKK
jgi:hypothetical protein